MVDIKHDSQHRTRFDRLRIIYILTIPGHSHIFQLRLKWPLCEKAYTNYAVQQPKLIFGINTVAYVSICEHMANARNVTQHK